MIVPWLAGNPTNELYELQKQIDNLNKALENLRQWEKVYLEKAAEQLEQAEKHRRRNSERFAIHYLNIKAIHEGGAQFCRNLQLTVQDKLILISRLKNEAIEELHAKDHIAKKTTHRISECGFSVAGMTIVTWLSGKPNKNIYELQQAIVLVNKRLESLKQWEKDCLERAAINLEKAKEHSRQNNKDDALHYLKVNKLFERTAQTSRNYQLTAHEQLIAMERVINNLTEGWRNEDHTTKKTTHVFIYFSLLLLILSYLVSSIY